MTLFVLFFPASGHLGTSKYSKIREITKLWREKTDKEKSHKGIWRSGCPRGVPGTNSGRPRDTWDIWAWFMCKSILKGHHVPGTDGTYHGTDGTCPRDRRDAHQGVSRQSSLCLLVFFFPKKMTNRPCFTPHLYPPCRFSKLWLKYCLASPDGPLSTGLHADRMN